MSSYRELFATCHFNIFDLSRFSYLSSEEDPGHTSWIKLFDITVNGLWLLVVVVKSFFLDVAMFFDSFLNLLFCIRFNISKGA